MMMMMMYKLCVRTTNQIYTKILPEMYLWTRKSSLNLAGFASAELRNLWVLIEFLLRYHK